MIPLLSGSFMTDNKNLQLDPFSSFTQIDLEEFYHSIYLPNIYYS